MGRRHVVRLVVLLVFALIGLLYRSVTHVPAPPREAGTTATPAPRAEPPATAAPISHSEIGFRSDERLREHFEKHGAEFGAASAADYLARAQALRDAPAGGDVLEETRADGVTCRFDRASGAFLAFDRDLVIRTYFRPNDGERYFRRQLEREHRSGR